MGLDPYFASKQPVTCVKHQSSGLVENSNATTAFTEGESSSPSIYFVSTRFSQKAPDLNYSNTPQWNESTLIQ